MNKYNEIQLMKKINKEFDERCIKLRNRIQRIKNEEENYKKKMINFRKKEIHDKLIKDDKKKIKLELQRNKAEKDRELYSKKKLIQSQRKKDIECRVHKKNANLSQKKINYQTSLNDKYLMKIIREQLNTQQLNKNIYTHAKIKQELNEFETNKMKRNLEKETQIQQLHENNIIQLKRLEKEMKNTCTQLEELEKEAIESLNKTKYMNLKIVGENPYNYPIGVNKKRNNFKKQVKSMENLNMSEISEKNDDEQNNPNKSVLVKKNKNMSPIHKNQNKNLNFKNKSKTKYGRTISINTFPKNNKALSKQKSSVVHKNENKKNNEKVKK